MSIQVSPLAPSVVPRLLPEFTEFWNEGLAYQPGIHELPWSPDIRKLPPQPGGSTPIEVGSVKDITLETCKVRVFTPEGEPPSKGWPVMIYFHGGGWTLGNISTENVMTSHLCKKANIVVIAVDYRLGPEDPFPAASNDAHAVLLWVLEKGRQDLNVDITRLGLGGSSSGGNLAAIVHIYAASHKPEPIPVTYMYLNVPVIDNTASLEAPAPGEPPHPYPSWLENADTPSLTPAKMKWFRDNYLPPSSPTYEQDLRDWRASPVFAPDDVLAKSLPKYTFVGVCELDVLRDEGLAYAEKLKKIGARVDTKVYKGAPHPVMAMDARLKVGRECIDDSVEAAIRGFVM